MTHRVDPVDVGADSGEDGGLLGVIAAEPRAKADDAMHLPGTGGVLAVQWATRVSLGHVTENPWSEITKCQNILVTSLVSESS